MYTQCWITRSDISRQYMATGMLPQGAVDIQDFSLPLVFRPRSPSVRLIYGECITRRCVWPMLSYNCSKSLQSLCARRCVFALMSGRLNNTLETIVQVSYINFVAPVMMPRPYITTATCSCLQSQYAVITVTIIVISNIAKCWQFTIDFSVELFFLQFRLTRKKNSAQISATFFRLTFGWHIYGDLPAGCAISVQAASLQCFGVSLWEMWTRSHSV